MRGDVKTFHKGRLKASNGSWAESDHLYLALITDAVDPTIDMAAPNISSFTQVGTGGTYTSGGVDLGTLSDFVSEAAGVLKFDSAVNPSWAADAGNSANDCFRGVIHHYPSGDGYAFVDFAGGGAGPYDMQTEAVAVNWNDLGIAQETDVTP